MVQEFSRCAVCTGWNEKEQSNKRKSSDANIESESFNDYVDGEWMLMSYLPWSYFVTHSMIKYLAEMCILVAANTGLHFLSSASHGDLMLP